MNRPVSVLTVDDDRTVLRLLRTLLQQMDIVDVQEATDGLDALEKLGARRSDLIISDWHMQPMDGLGLLRHVRRDPVLAHIPFVMVTAECGPERVADAYEAGTSAYICKPFNAKMLRETIQAMVRP